MTEPVGSPPLCSVWVDGKRMADGQPADPELDPTVLTDLSVVWGRPNSLDQPAPATCTFKVMDLAGGQTFTNVLHIGARVDVRTDATIYPEANLEMLPDPGFELGTASWVVSNGTVAIVASPVHTGTKALRLTPIDGTKPITLDIIPAPFSANPSAWDHIPRAKYGQSWGYGGWVHLANELGVANQAVAIQPVAYLNPNGSNPEILTGTAPQLGPGAPAGWARCAGTVLPPNDAWLGLRVRIYPTGPAWVDVAPAVTWESIDGASGPMPTTGITAFGDSITAGTWLPQYSDSWIPKLAARLGVTITNRAVGGAALHSPGGDPNILMAQVTAALAAGQPSFGTAIILVGTNDLMTHDTNTLSQSVAAARDVQAALVAKGVRVIWLGVLPMGKGTSHSDNDLPALLQRRLALNPQLESIAGADRWYNTERLFGADAGGLVTDPSWLLDGLHPSAKGATQLADQFPGQELSPSFAGWTSWDDLGAVGIDDVSIKAPSGGVAKAGLVFSGRVTDLDASYELSVGGTVVRVICEDNTAELANRYVGDQPWAEGTLLNRFAGVLWLTGQEFDYSVGSTIANKLVSYRDVDSQPALRLLQELGASVAGVLWSATNLVTGPFLRLDDVGARTALKQLIWDGSMVVIRIKDPVPAEGVTISACSLLLDPVKWHQASDDDSTEVSVIWLDQVVADGAVKPTSRTVTLRDDGAERATGRRRIMISSQLSRQLDAEAVASVVLARTRTPG